jgi:nicotinate-nucleotide adenylyltransferase
VHRGHIRLARAATHECQLNWLYFVPARRSPFKGQPALSIRTRLAKVRVSVQMNPLWRLSLFEIHRSQPTYTFQTLAYFQKRFPQARIYCVMGSDSLKEVPSWKKGWRLLKRASFVVGKRPGVRWPNVPKRWRHRVVYLKTPMADISSTKLRAHLDKKDL